MTERILKTSGIVWEAVERGDKTFEVRRNDRFFQQGDMVVLRIGWMLHGGQYGLEPGYVAFQLVKP